MRLFRYRFFIYYFFYWIAFLNSYSQEIGNTIIKGTVVDAKTNQPVPFVTVILGPVNIGTTTDLDGRYSIVSKEPANKIQFSLVSYETETQSISPGKTQIINIKLMPSYIKLNEVVIKPTKKIYKNKDNPSVELIKNVIENKSKNRKESLDYFEYEKYEKIQFALSNFTEKFKQRKTFGEFQFVFDNIDTTKQPGKEILPFFIKETISDYYYRKNPKASKEIIVADKIINFEEYVDNQGVTANLKYLYQDINIYNNSILFLTNQFVSPIAIGAPAFYKYDILDTLQVNDVQCLKVFFVPRNKTDFLFQGFLYITRDSSFAVKKIEMWVNNDINLDWVKYVKIVQEFNKIQQQGWLLSKDEISIDFGITKNSMGLFGQRTVSYKNYRINEERGDSIYSGLEIIKNKDAGEQNTDYWELHRHEQLTKSEKGVYVVVDSVKKVPSFKRAMNVLMLLSTDFMDLGNIEIGPVNTFYSFNPIEGDRLRFGGRTTPEFSKKINFETYVAYGFADKNYKYYLGTTYSLTSKTIYQFPVKSIKISYQNDTKIPGQELQFVQDDNIFLSLKRGVNDKLLYNKTFKIEYLNEFENHFSYTLGYSYLKQNPAGNLYYNYDSYLSIANNIKYINIPEVYLILRYAPHEEFYQGKLYRDSFTAKYPVFQVQYALGSQSLKNNFDYQKIQLSIKKRFYLSLLGYTDIIWEAGKIFGKVPYPLLFIHRANQSYTYQTSSYNMMNFLEFVSDQYVSLNIDHSFNGNIFNKIPLLKKLKLREVVTCKVLYGGVSKMNNPDYQANLFKFPVDISGNPLTYTLEKKPYVEASIGVSNILKIFRIDLVKRLTYLDHQNITGIGVRVRFKFDL